MTRPMQKRPAPKTGTLIRERRLALDLQARKYADLLADPCHADLTYPIYTGAGGGILVRAESYVTLFNSATNTGGVIHWVPGALNFQAGFANNLLTGGDSGAGVTMTVGAQNWIPGSNLINLASGVRTVAACAQVMWPGTELNRQGFVLGGNTAGDFVKSGSVLTNAAVANGYLANHLRIPDSDVEFVWRPQFGDQEFNDPNDTTSILENHGAITIAINNIPVSTGIRLRTVAVYEFLPTYSSGFATSNNVKNRSSNTIDHVLDALDNAGDWTFKVGMGVNKAMRIANDVYSVGRAVGQIATRAAPLLLGI